jgi:hypothetical protein
MQEKNHLIGAYVNETMYNEILNIVKSCFDSNANYLRTLIREDLKKRKEGKKDADSKPN